MRIQRKIIAMTALSLLSACSQQQSEQAQQAASAAIGAAHQRLQDSSAPLAKLRQQASNVAAEAKQQFETLATSSPALGSAIAILKPASTTGSATQWRELENKVGRYPAEIGLYQTGAVADALRQLLGNKFVVFQHNMQVSGPLSRDQLLFVSGNKPHEGGSEMAYLLLDPPSRQLEVGLIEQGQLTVYRSGPALYRPAEISTMLGNITHQP
jgi:hypothetical protein